jgi:tRNA-specific 2-thiouridylase
VGKFDKSSIRTIASHHQLITADKPESQEICFVPDGDYPKFIRRNAEEVDSAFLPILQRFERPGAIRFKDGRVIGTHEGIYHFTVGQRKGLGIAHSRPLYVIQLDVKNNAVVVGYQEDAYSQGLVADRVNWLSRIAPENHFEAKVRIRANHIEAPAQIQVHPGGDGFKALFQEPQLAVTPGQAAVIYRQDRVLGGGWITSSISK